jgi:hypothetical protein
MCICTSFYTHEVNTMDAKIFLTAARYGDVDTINKGLEQHIFIFKNKGSDTAKDDNGDTALELAIIWNHTGVALAIIAFYQKHDLSIPGEKALDLAHKFQRYEVLGAWPTSQTIELQAKQITASEVTIEGFLSKSK